MKMSQAFPSKFVKPADLNGKHVTLTIAKIVIEQLGHGAEAERKPVVYFLKATKGLVLNRTNAMTLVGMYGDESDDWVGKRVTLFATRIRAFGTMQDTIRVKDEVPPVAKAPASAQATGNPQAPVEEELEIDDEEDVTDGDEGRIAVPA